MTKYAEQILDLINHSYDHPTAEQIYMRMKQDNPKMALASVYNNLGALVKDEKIRKITVPDGPDHYDRTERHDHMICCNCGKIRDLYEPDFTEFIEKNAGVKIQSYDLKINYICEECQKTIH